MTTLYPTTKVCASCKLEKPLSEYRPWARGIFGVRPRCADCEREYERERNRGYKIEHRYNPRNKSKKSSHDGYRFCNACEQEKPYGAFHFRNGKPLATCIECERARDRERNLLRRPRKTIATPEPIHEGCKVCNTCFKEKPYADFQRSKQQKDGYAGRCKQCKIECYDASPEGKEAKQVYNNAYREANLEALHAYDRQRYKTPQRQSTHLSSLRKRHAVIHGVYAEEVDYQHILERDGYWCYICQKPILPGQKFAFDHVIPLIPRCGEPHGFHTEENIKPTHRVCNSRKSNKPLLALTPFDRRGVD